MCQVWNWGYNGKNSCPHGSRAWQVTDIKSNAYDKVLKRQIVKCCGEIWGQHSNGGSWGSKFALK